MKELSEIHRRPCRRIKVGEVEVGGGSPISLQSMTNTDTRDPRATLAQIKELAGIGCEIIRVAVPDQEAAQALRKICLRSPLPVIADIHFDYRLALKSIEAGVDGLRINPGNIGADWKVREVVRACRERKIPIRVGVNEGSLSREDEARYTAGHPEVLAENALREVSLIEKQDYREIKISAKTFSIRDSLRVYRLLAQEADYPLHLGITEAGPLLPGTVRSAIGIGALLLEGIGDTIRVSLSAPPVEEIRVAKEILQSLGLRRFGPTIISCPTCGRCSIDLLSLVDEVQKRIEGLPEKEALSALTVAVMGCEVNGPGEARQADVGLAGGSGRAILFKKGKVLKSVPADEAVEELITELLGLKREQH